MTLTLLIDLDDTLLINNAELFQQAYLKALAEHLERYVPPKQLTEQLLIATRALYRKKSPRGTLKSTFDANFYPTLGVSQALLEQPINDFYANAFPSLRTYTQPRPEAVDLVERAMARGHRVVVATNPLFPRVAILERLRWALLPPETYPFTLIPDYETFHFCKPNPAFLAEILATLQWPEGSAVMIGNSAEEDILPAETLGLPTYWVNASSHPSSIQQHPLSCQGPLAGVLDWLNEIEKAARSLEIKSPPAIMAALAATPAAIETLTRTLIPSLWVERPAPQEWAINEIICHLRDVDAEVNLQRLDLLLSEENPFIPGVNTDNWAEVRNYHAQNGLQALEGFMAVRTMMLERLETLSPADWQRSARHAIFGPTTLQEIMEFVVTHDRTHIRQVGNTIDRVMRGNSS